MIKKPNTIPSSPSNRFFTKIFDNDQQQDIDCYLQEIEKERQYFFEEAHTINVFFKTLTHPVNWLERFNQLIEETIALSTPFK